MVVGAFAGPGVGVGTAFGAGVALAADVGFCAGAFEVAGCGADFCAGALPLAGLGLALAGSNSIYPGPTTTGTSAGVPATAVASVNS